jgi:hypothetical protein
MQQVNKKIDFSMKMNIDDLPIKPIKNIQKFDNEDALS